ncbi:hypothetical protein M427DRAFT_43450 [Gonapodya prolifera JEL478]|uniref:Osmotin, thaumatin-like protein n=1 Tax=Gonapodya prolifera (strain JEL478) TaxID=1344416 RepID=A0A139AIM3_GONPJ|nr:hypothetical protein M427DRAFT_43450 [Gonapodya prolifera JEL478]|eukprot:KXS16647.1 hypothetical protein M427DRAFT_43450 [Gonapodya prolifera JEL478]
MKYTRTLLALALAAFSAAAVAAQQVALTWDAAAVDAQCRAAVTGSGNTYDGKFDITYSAGLSGALSGTIGSGITITAGTYSAMVNYTLAPTWSFGACCISPTATGGPKFRCCCGASNIAITPNVSTAPANVYAACPAGTDLTTPIATLGDGTRVFQNGPISYCSAGSTGASPAPAPAASGSGSSTAAGATGSPSAAATPAAASASSPSSTASATPKGNGVGTNAALSALGLVVSAVVAIVVA